MVTLEEMQLLMGFSLHALLGWAVQLELPLKASKCRKEFTFINQGWLHYQCEV